MTEADADLVERLRRGVLISTETTPAFILIMPDGSEQVCGPSTSEIRQKHPLADEAADRIASLEAEVKRLKWQLYGGAPNAGRTM